MEGMYEGLEFLEGAVQRRRRNLLQAAPAGAPAVQAAGGAAGSASTAAPPATPSSGPTMLSYLPGHLTWARQRSQLAPRSAASPLRGVVATRALAPAAAGGLPAPAASTLLPAHVQARLAEWLSAPEDPGDTDESFLASLEDCTLQR